MPRRVLLAGLHFFLTILTVLTVLAVSPVVAQEVTTISISTTSDKVTDLLERGRELESERRWGDALTHYEDAVRLYPNESSLRRGFESARLHYDLQRRYIDRSFVGTMTTLPLDDALSLYSEVLLKIQAHYVEAINWRQLVEHGTDDLCIALSEPAFARQYKLAHDRDVLERFCQNLRGAIESMPVESRIDARNAVAAAAQMAQRDLHLPGTAVALEYLCGATNALDPYSAYLTPDQLNEVYSQIEGNFVGLGIELKARDAGLSIVRVIPGSPAEASGILAGDSILSVDGQPTEGVSTDQAANLLQGPEGSTVTLDVRTGEQPSRRLSVRRSRVDVPSIDDAHIIERTGGIGYLHLVSFQKTTCRDLDAALWELHDQGMQSLIIDLRGNPGGLLTTAVEVSDKFVQSGVIVSTRGRNAQEDFTYSARTPGTWRVPLVVLIDRETASAAEIFAGAIQEHRRGTVVGLRSYGKGSVQGIFPLGPPGAAGIRLTTAKFFAPSGRAYSWVGVEPDVEVRVAARPIEGTTTVAPVANDAMLAAAVQAARELGLPRQAALGSR